MTDGTLQTRPDKMRTKRSDHLQQPSFRHTTVQVKSSRPPRQGTHTPLVAVPNAHLRQSLPATRCVHHGPAQSFRRLCGIGSLRVAAGVTSRGSCPGSPCACWCTQALHPGHVVPAARLPTRGAPVVSRTNAASSSACSSKFDCTSESRERGNSTTALCSSVGSTSKRSVLGFAMSIAVTPCTGRTEDEVPMFVPRGMLRQMFPHSLSTVSPQPSPQPLHSLSTSAPSSPRLRLLPLAAWLHVSRQRGRLNDANRRRDRDWPSVKPGGEGRCDIPHARRDQDVS